MKIITAKEQKLISQIIADCYNNAAASFSQLTGQKVIIESAAVELCTDHQYLISKYAHLQDLTIIQTEIIGRLRGESYLIMNEEEKKSVAKMSLESFGSNSALDENIILLEIDNIISAAVITELSNKLQLRIYGDVPKLLSLQSIEDLHLFINQDENDQYILTNSTFIFENSNRISPIFIWKIDKQVIEIVNSINK